MDGSSCSSASRRLRTVLTAALVLLLASVTAAGTQPTAVGALHQSGQTFVTWTESVDPTVESYRVYRHDQPIDAVNLGAAALLREVWEGSGEFYADRYYKPIPDTWQPRYLTRFVITNGGLELTAGTGLLVWTLAEEDFGGGTSGPAYYAVTSVDDQGFENVINFSVANSIGPVSESVDFPAPVLSKTAVGGTHKIYTQFMDLRTWNATMDAPGPNFGYFGLNPSLPSVFNSIQYAYTYAVVPPTGGACQDLGTTKPLVVYLHGHGGHKYRPLTADSDPTWCDAFRIYPVDISNSWWFGFANDYDYRFGSGMPPPSGSTIENFTEQRVLRMVKDLLRDSTYGPQIDPERIYVVGHSMGGGGTMAMALRYPGLFAGAYADQAMMDQAESPPTVDDDFVADAIIKWGSVFDNLPVAFGDVEGEDVWIAPYEGTGVWDWQDHQENLETRVGDPAVPFGQTHSISDPVIDWPTQGAPSYAAYETSRHVWAGAVKNITHVSSAMTGLPPTMGEDGFGLPFAGFQVVRSESLPAFHACDTDPEIPPMGVVEYHHGVEWSASWNDFDGPPIDTGPLWGVTLRSTDLETRHVDITPRRLQTFKTRSGQLYSWRNHRVSDGFLVDSGVVMGDLDDLVAIPQFEVTPGGNRLELRPVLAGNAHVLSVASGGTEQLEMVAGPDLGGRMYWMLGSASGTSPGIDLGGGFQLPLNFDGYLQYTISQPNSVLLTPSLSFLDGAGGATTQFSLPPGLDSGLIGSTLHHAYVVLDLPVGTGQVLFVSSAVQTELIP